MNGAFVESIKEIIRLAVFAGVAAVVSALLAGVNQLPESTTTVVLTFLLRAADKFVHENKDIKMSGLVPF